MSLNCPALFISAPASGQGKTTFTAALARYHHKQGRRVRVFKTGPDFLDPMILEVASGHPVYQLDLWMLGEQECRQRLYNAAKDADLILIEGVMGLFDGTPSSADLAQVFGIPITALIDAGAMAQTFGALAYGLAHYRPGLPFAGVVANRVGSDGHTQMLLESLGEIPLLGALPRDEAATLPSRHLGLVQAAELPDLESRLDATAALIEHSGMGDLPAPVAFTEVETGAPPRLLEGVRIGIARDEAFAFIYPANTELLETMGAELHYFSPLHDTTLPEVDSLWLPGGYPELHLSTLQGNTAMRDQIRKHYQSGKPMLAECGGMLYLCERLTDKDGESAELLGLLPATATMQTRLVALGMQSVDMGEGELRGHTFHHSRMETTLAPSFRSTTQHGKQAGEAIYRPRGLTATYLHLYFPSHPTAVSRLFKSGESKPT